MGWGLAAAWLAVAGLVILTFGTGVQAWANLAEFKTVSSGDDPSCCLELPQQ